MKPSITFKNINSKDMGISILKLPPRIKPEQRGEKITIPGRNGFLFESDDGYNGKTLEIECTFLPPENYSENQIKELIMQIPLWLDGMGKLICSDYPELYYDATIINSISIERMMKLYRRFTLEIEVQPFSKSIQEYTITKNTITEETININSYYNSYPEIIVTGTGTISITINNKTMILNDVSNPITLDCELMNATENNGLTNVNNKVNGEYPFLKPGNNTISIVLGENSSLTSLEIKYRGTWI